MQMSFKWKYLAPGLAAGAMACFAPLANAEVTLLKAQPDGGSAWDRLELQFGGSIRYQYFNQMGNQDSGSYKHRGYDGGTRFRFTANYYLNDDLTLLGYYEPGVDLMHVLDLDGQYQEGNQRTTRRMVYFGVSSKKYGTLTAGKQNSVYYTTVGVKTDVWDNDMHAQAPGVGINGDYDGSYRARKSLKYSYNTGPVTVYLGWLFPDDELHADNHVDYRRKSGGSIGLDYQINLDLVFSAAYSNTDAEAKVDGGQESYRQELTGTALTWTPGQWYLSAGAGYYRNFVPYQTDRYDEFFNGDAYGLEYIARYTVPVNNAWLESIQPYVAGDRLKRLNGSKTQENHQYIGLTTQLHYGFRVDLERTFANTSSNEPDANLVRLRYDF